MTAANANHADDGAATVNSTFNAASTCLQFVGAYIIVAIAASSAAAVLLLATQLGIIKKNIHKYTCICHSVLKSSHHCLTLTCL